MTEPQPNGHRRMLVKLLNVTLIALGAASAGWIAAYERRLASVEGLAATTATTQQQRGERIGRVEGRLDRHEDALADLRADLGELKTGLMEIRELLIQSQVVPPRGTPRPVTPPRSYTPPRPFAPQPPAGVPSR